MYAIPEIAHSDHWVVAHIKATLEDDCMKRMLRVTTTEFISHDPMVVSTASHRL